VKLSSAPAQGSTHPRYNPKRQVHKEGGGFDDWEEGSILTFRRIVAPLLVPRSGRACRRACCATVVLPGIGSVPAEAGDTVCLFFLFVFFFLSFPFGWRLGERWERDTETGFGMGKRIFVPIPFVPMTRGLTKHWTGVFTSN
jgi:hypothetical protein